MIVNILGFTFKKYKYYAQQIATMALEYMGYKNLELSIKFVSRKEIRRLNREFRQTDRVTDVLSFPATNVKVGEKVAEGEYLGDMALCMKKCRAQGKEYQNGTIAELRKLIIHSVLHLLGYDHIEDKDYEIMKPKEEEIEKYIKEQ